MYHICVRWFPCKTQELSMSKRYWLEEKVCNGRIYQKTNLDLNGVAVLIVSICTLLKMTLEGKNLTQVHSKLKWSKTTRKIRTTVVILLLILFFSCTFIVHGCIYCIFISIHGRRQIDARCSANCLSSTYIQSKIKTNGQKCFDLTLP